MAETWDREKLVAWLNNQPQEVSVAIAARTALRVIPLLTSGSGGALTEKWRLPLVFASFRATLSAAVATVAPSKANQTISHLSAALAASNSDSSFAFASDYDLDRAEVEGVLDKLAHASAMICSSAAHSVDPNELDRFFNSLSELGVQMPFAHPAFWSEIRNDAALFEKAGSIEGVFGEALWSDGQPAEFIRHRNKLIDWMSENLDLTFWSHWYNSMEKGLPLNWSIAAEIVEIDHPLWTGAGGASLVAEEIAEIRERYRPKLDPERVREASERLASAPLSSQAATDQFATRIEDLITEFLGKAGLNQLPKELAAYHHLPAIFRTISVSVASDALHEEKIAELQKEIASLHETIAQLNADLEAASRSVFSEEFVKALGKSCVDPMWWAKWGGIAAAGYTFVTNPAGASALIEAVVTNGQKLLEAEKAGK